MASSLVPAPALSPSSHAPRQSRMAALNARVGALLAGLKVQCARAKRGNADKVAAAIKDAAARGAWPEDKAARALGDADAIFGEMTLERERVAKAVGSGLDSLEQLNIWLETFGLPAAPSKTQAKIALSGVFINIYDLEGGIDKAHESLAALRTYTKKNSLWFPREAAKDLGLRAFLKVLRG